MISLIVAASRNGVIGDDGALPWRLPDDLKRFKQVTMGKPIVMGRKTYESIGRPLPGRRNIVITRKTGYVVEGCEVFASPQDALSACEDVEEVMIIGGGEIYAAFLPMAERIYFTLVHADVDGDARFELPEDDWQTVSTEGHAADSAHRYDFEFRILERQPRD